MSGMDIVSLAIEAVFVVDGQLMVCVYGVVEL